MLMCGRGFTAETALAAAGMDAVLSSDESSVQAVLVPNTIRRARDVHA